MDDAQQQKATGENRHMQVMERYKSLNLSIDDRGVVQLTSDQQRRIFSYGYFVEGQAPKHFTNYKQVDEGITLLQGMGLPALSNLELLYFVGGKLTAMHRLCLAACQATGQMEKHHVIFLNAKNEQLSEQNAVGFAVEACVVRVRRRGQDQDAIGVFSLDDAKRAGLYERNKNWQNYPLDMLMHRSSMRALSQQFSDILSGVSCKEIQEEYQQVTDESGQPATAPDGSQIFRRRLQRLRESEQAFARIKGEGPTS